MSCYEYTTKISAPQVEIILKLGHLFRALELSPKWKRGLNANNTKYISEKLVAEFYYNYFAPHNIKNHN